MDYKKLGLKCGLEIHQQLDTSKLFCNCPSTLRQDKPDIIIKRELRPLAGEIGKIDVAALFEKKKKMYYIYEAYSNTTCEVEIDEAPPHNINQEALEIALTVAKMFHCRIPDVIQVMRKTVVDGSDPSGFQRTALVGLNGWVNTSKGRIGIENISLEEDAGRRTREDKESVTFRLDRMGIPELEIGTDSSINSPELAKEVAKIIGDMLRSTSKVKRGLGTIRQDINVSIRKGGRTEIKMVQELSQIPILIEKEVERQFDLIKSRKKIEKTVRNAKEDGSTKFLRPLPGAARMYPETDLPLISITREKITEIKLPESLEDKRKRYLELGLNAEIVNQLVNSNYNNTFDKFINKYKNISSKIIADTLLSTPKAVRRKASLEMFEVPEKDINFVLDKVNKKQLASSAIFEVLLKLAKGVKLEDAVSKFKLLSDKELKQRIAEIKEMHKDLSEGAIIGKAMAELRGKADNRKIVEFIKS